MGFSTSIDLINTKSIKYESFVIEKIFINNDTIPLDSIARYDLPPRSFPTKDFKYIDYSYKLFSKNNNKIIVKENYYKGKSVQFLEKIKDTAPDEYEYYKKAIVYFKSLSIKVKQIYTVDELWYIYMFDRKLRKRLTNI